MLFWILKIYPLYLKEICFWILWTYLSKEMMWRGQAEKVELLETLSLKFCTGSNGIFSSSSMNRWYLLTLRRSSSSFNFLSISFRCIIFSSFFLFFSHELSQMVPERSKMKTRHVFSFILRFFLHFLIQERNKKC